jgi:hypothetical protein
MPGAPIGGAPIGAPCGGGIIAPGGIMGRATFVFIIGAPGIPALITGAPGIPAPGAPVGGIAVAPRVGAPGVGIPALKPGRNRIRFEAAFIGKDIGVVIKVFQF